LEKEQRKEGGGGHEKVTVMKVQVKKEKGQGFRRNRRKVTVNKLGGKGSDTKHLRGVPWEKNGVLGGPAKGIWKGKSL